MNAPTLLHDAYTTLLKAACAVPQTAWRETEVCGTWTIQDVLAHMASFEQVTVEALTGFLRAAPTPLIDQLVADNLRFNEEQVAQRCHLPAQAILDEYDAAHATAQRLLEQIPPEMRQQNGTLPWYGNEYDLDDYLAYMYGHAREHAAQIDHFRTTHQTVTPSDQAADDWPKDTKSLS